MTEFFADTYALVAIATGAPSYERYASFSLITSHINLAELYYALLREHDKETAERYLNIFANAAVPISLSCIRKGMLLKFQYKNEKLSYADCLGWALAPEYGIKFLTGDKKFEGKPNVEFVR